MTPNIKRNLIIKLQIKIFGNIELVTFLFSLIKSKRIQIMLDKYITHKIICKFLDQNLNLVLGKVPQPPRFRMQASNFLERVLLMLD